MTKKKIMRYSEAFKRQIVAEYETGIIISDLQKKYGITGGMTIPRWIKKYAKQGFRHELVRIQTAEEANRVKELEEQVQELEQALGKVVLEKLKLESILEELEEMYGVEVKKTKLDHRKTFSKSQRAARTKSEHGSNLCPVWYHSPGSLSEGKTRSAATS